MVVEEVEEFVKRAFRRSKMISHDYLHVLRVRKLAVEIGKKEGADIEVLELASLLHDIALALGKEKHLHAEESAKIAKKILKGKISEEKLNKIIDAIENHSYSKGTVPRSLEGKILQDADRLDAIGAIGVCRAIVYGALKSRALYDADDPFAERRELKEDEYTIDHFFTKLLKIDMNTETAKREAERRIKFMKYFLEELKREIL